MRRKLDMNNIELTEHEVMLAAALASTLDPNNFVYDEAKAVIHKCKAILKQGQATGTIGFTIRRG